MPSRLLITGNSGSGKSWLAGRLAAQLNLPLHRLDDVVWAGAYGGRERDKAEAHAEAERLAASENWVIEGVYGWLLPAALPRATEFVFIDLPVEECLANLRARGLQGGGSAEAFEKLLAWVADYPLRINANSLATHRRLFDQFAGPKHRLSSREDLAAYLAERLR